MLSWFVGRECMLVTSCRSLPERDSFRGYCEVSWFCVQNVRGDSCELFESIMTAPSEEMVLTRCSAVPSCVLDGLIMVVPLDNGVGAESFMSSTPSFGLVFGRCFWILLIRPGTGPRFFLASLKVQLRLRPVQVLQGLDISHRTLRSLFRSCDQQNVPERSVMLRTCIGRMLCRLMTSVFHAEPQQLRPE